MVRGMRKILLTIIFPFLFILTAYASTNIKEIKKIEIPIANKFFSNDKGIFLVATPSKALKSQEYEKFRQGKTFFSITWLASPSVIVSRDGLGPLYNANSCNSCHLKIGQGKLIEGDNLTSKSLIAKLSIKSNDSPEHQELLQHQGFVPEPVYGTQLATNAVKDVDFEGQIKVDFEEIETTFPDGEKVTLLKPKYSLENLNYGELNKDTNISYRMTPTLNGIGLIGLISNEDILANEDIDDKDGDGISGHANWVYSKSTRNFELGKYGWKATVSSLKEQIASDALEDIGLITSINSSENCTKSQDKCNNAPKSKDSIDLPDEKLDAITYYLENMKNYAPKDTNEYKEGLSLFEEISCGKCHISSFNTKEGFQISPFSDFLLHDMGEDLSDGRSEFFANANEWRTAPLWGLSLYKNINKDEPRFLHDGRARNYQEAILWHGGEAQMSKENYMNLPKEKRDKLIEFLEQL